VFRRLKQELARSSFFKKKAHLWPENGVVAIIPARYGSSRFPGKPLALLSGKPIIEHVVQRTSQADTVDTVIVATDDERIYRCVKDFGGEAIMTSKDHPTGTDRIGEVASQILCDIVVNVQGDEPAIKPSVIDAAVAPLLRDRKVQMSTLATDISDIDELKSPHVVKVVTDLEGYALYFSRSPIPGSRHDSRSRVSYKKHIGLYVFRSDFLSLFIGFARSPLEMAEELEQLRALENGYRIKVVHATYDSIGVDTPEDLEKLERLSKKGALLL
jgi:3-deoxy-manno-octulosonate cytidylyltransferase (CMP-KDO synthetase)